MTPRLIAWLVGIGLVAVLGAVFLGGPIVSFYKAQAAKWEAKEETAQDTAASHDARADANKALGDQQGEIATQVVERHTETIRYVEKASAAPDAKAPLGPDREQRIADHTAFLCKQRPGVCGTSPEGSDPGVR